MNNVDEVETFFCQLHKGNQYLIMEVASKLTDVQRMTENKVSEPSRDGGEESV